MFRLFAFGGLRLEGPDGPARGAAAQSHPLAVLAIIGAAGTAGVSRDKLLGLLWPDRTEERARHVLSQSLYALRRSLGTSDLLIPGGVPRLNQAVISSDVGDFVEAIRAGDDETAVALHAGPFLDSFYLSGVPEFESWASGTRERLSRQYAGALERVARRAAAEGDQSRSIELLQKLAALDPLDSRVLLELLQAMDAAGERAAAIRRGDAHQELLRLELGISPSREVAELLCQLRKNRSRSVQRSPTPVSVVIPPTAAVTPAGTTAAPSPMFLGESGALLPFNPSRHPAPTSDSGRISRRLTIAVGIAATIVLGVAIAFGRGSDEPRVTPTSVAGNAAIPRGFYEEGLRAFYAADHASAQRLFSAALAADSIFAMAAHYLALATIEAQTGAERNIERARRLAQRATDRERLLILHYWSAQLDDPAAYAYADTLSRRYPADPDAQLAVARTRLSQGDFPDAIRRLRDIVTTQGISRARTGERCRGCEASGWLVYALELADSLPAAEQLVRESLRTHGGERTSWGKLGTLLERQGRIGEADSAYAREASLTGGTPEPVWRPVLMMRGGDFAGSERMLRRLSEGSIGAVHDRTRELLATVLRNRGRPDEALGVARAIQRQASSATGGRSLDPFARLPLALALMQSGRGREAAAQFDTMATLSPFKSSASRTARHRAWMMAHRARALAIAGDTTALVSLADTVREVGARSAYGRDQRLHYYVHGLLCGARRDWPRAVAELRKARYSTTETYLAVPLARAELAMGDAPSAARTASAALRGPLDSQNQYELRVELHELLADALLATGDSAAAASNYKIVAGAWEGAERPFAQRGLRARAQWQSLTGRQLRTVATGAPLGARQLTHTSTRH